MKLLSIYSLLFFFSMTLFSAPGNWAKEINRNGKEGYQITFTIPKDIKLFFSNQSKKKSYFVSKESTIGETAKAISRDLRGKFLHAFILIDGHQHHEFEWSTMITALESFSEDEKNHVPRFEVVAHQYRSSLFR